MTKGNEARLAVLRAAIAGGRESGEGKLADEMLDRLAARYRALAAERRR